MWCAIQGYTDLGIKFPSVISLLPLSMIWSAKLVLQKLSKSLAKQDPDLSGTSLALLA